MTDAVHHQTELLRLRPRRMLFRLRDGRLVAENYSPQDGPQISVNPYLETEPDTRLLRVFKN